MRDYRMIDYVKQRVVNEYEHTRVIANEFLAQKIVDDVFSPRGKIGEMCTTWSAVNDRQTCSSVKCARFDAENGPQRPMPCLSTATSEL